ncbi:hypothetical protein [Rhodococcus sp. MALMAid1271]|uniref:hypothetical protein n=1 Tax=Rhodococcus sp. MALMAid1271 TaxID=3411744 RepID=UPI003BA1AC59
MTTSNDDLTRLMQDIAEKRDARRAEEERIAAERTERLRAAGMSDDQIRVACGVMQELLDEQVALCRKEWDRAMEKVKRRVRSGRNTGRGDGS